MTLKKRRRMKFRRCDSLRGGGLDRERHDGFRRSPPLWCDRATLTVCRVASESCCSCCNRECTRCVGPGARLVRAERLTSRRGGGVGGVCRARRRDTTRLRTTAARVSCVYGVTSRSFAQCHATDARRSNMTEEITTQLASVTWWTRHKAAGRWCG